MTRPNSGWTPLRTMLERLPLTPYLVNQQMLAQARSELRSVGFEIAEVDASTARDERDLLESLGGVLGFPDYFRPNWDAFDDCLGDMMREEAAPTALLVVGADALLATNPHDFARTVHLLCSVVEAIERDSGAFRLEVLFLGRWNV